MCRRLLDDGHDLICVDDLSTGHRSNIEPLFDRSGFRFVQHDIRETFDARVDQIYNLACPAAPPRYRHAPIKTLTTSVQGSTALLELARCQGARLLFTSSSEVYGDPDIHPQSEDDWGRVNPIGPRACYNEGKRCAEAMHSAYALEYGVEVKIARVFNTYGPQMPLDDGRVVPNFIVQALMGAPLSVHGTGEQTRSFCYVDDLIEALVRLMASPSGLSGPINLGNPHEVSVLSLASTVQRLTGADSTIDHCELPIDDPRRRRPNISLARTMLDWEPHTGLEAGLKRTIAYFAQRLSHRAKHGATQATLCHT